MADGSNRYLFPGACLFLVLLILINSLVNGSFGKIGIDSDDIMRLVQIRDYFSGSQSWFDTNQYRMGGVNGTEMHWSRLVDVPIVLLIAFFDLFLPYSSAEALAISLWPPLSSIIVIIGIFTGARHLGGQKAAWCAAIMAGIFLVTHYRFEPGAIDHHNLQIGLLCVTLGFAMHPEFEDKSFLISGIALGLSFAIGADIYPLGVIICAYIALLWLVKGEIARKGIIAFGLGFAGALIFSFLAVIAPANYGVVHCDALSKITVLAGVAGGGGLAAIAAFFSGKSKAIRLVALIGLAVICGLCLMLQAPQCLSNPLGTLPLEVKELWLDTVIEAEPIMANPETRWIRGPMGLGGAFVAAILCFLKIRGGDKPVRHGMFLGLFIVTIALSLYQLRYFVFPQFFAFIILGVWIAELLERRKANPDKVNIAHIGAIAAAIPMFWALPGVLFGPMPPEDRAEKVELAANCYSADVMSYIATLDKGRFAATNNGTSHLLKDTHHSGLSGNYHRNASGIEQNIKIFTGGNPEELLTAQEIDYLHFCSVTAESRVLQEHNPDGLMAQLMDNKVPAYLKPIMSLEDGTVTIFKIIPRRTAPAE